VAYAAKARARCLHRLQHRRDPITQLKIRMPDDGGGNFRGSVLAAGSLVSQTVDVSNLAHRAHFLRPVGAIKHFDLDKHGRAHVMPTVADIRGKVRQQVTLIGRRLVPMRPDVVMWVADGKSRLERGFRSESQPGWLADSHD
jgi:hypothetical protein